MKNDHQDCRNRARYAGLTKQEKEILLQRHVEAAELRQAENDHNLAVALRLGAALKQLKGEG